MTGQIFVSVRFALSVVQPHLMNTVRIGH